MIDFSRRSGDTEIMDDLEYAGEMMDRTLGELEVINRWLGGNRVTINGISKLLENGNHNSTIRVADLGCGRGDMLILIDEWAKKYNRKLELFGIDANQYVINAARKRLKRVSAHSTSGHQYSFPRFSEARNLTLLSAHFFIITSPMNN